MKFLFEGIPCCPLACWYRIKNLIIYLDKSNILIPDVKDTGTLQIHSVQREVPAKFNFYFNSPYKKGSYILQSIEYDLPTNDLPTNDLPTNDLPGTSATDTDHGNDDGDV